MTFRLDFRRNVIKASRVSGGTRGNPWYRVGGFRWDEAIPGSVTRGVCRVCAYIVWHPNLHEMSGPCDLVCKLRLHMRSFNLQPRKELSTCERMRISREAATCGLVKEGCACLWAEIRDLAP